MMQPVFDLYLTRHDPTRNMARFYGLEITADLLGGAVLIRRWGRVGTKGREMRHWFADPGAATLEQDDWRQRKLKRGYIECATDSMDDRHLAVTDRMI